MNKVKNDSNIGKLDTENIGNEGREKLLGFLAQLINFHEKELKLVFTHYLNAQKEQSNLDRLLFLFQAKIIKTLKAILLLCKGGFGEDSAQLTRSIFEIFINVLYILKSETKDRTRLFLEYNPIDHYDQLTRLKEKIDEKLILEEYERVLSQYDKKEIDEIRKFRSEKIQEYKIKKQIGINKKSWSLVTTKQMAIETGNEKLFDQIYWQISQISHPHEKGLENYFENRDGKTFFSDHPSSNWISESLIFSSDIFMRFLVIINEYFKLKLNTRIDLFRKEFLDLLKQN
jgi:hypothetical protein